MTLSKHELKKIVNELKGYRARHTELVTVYIPSGFNINVLRDQLAQEQSTASNIKSKTTRKNVLAALEKAFAESRNYKSTPTNGLAIFSGNVSNVEGVMDLRVWSFEPPEPVQVRMYRCEQEFILEPLIEMLEAKYVFGLIIVDDHEAVIGLLKGKIIRVLKEMTSLVPGKFRAGGQSAQRFQRVRQEMRKDWFNTVGQTAIDLFSQYNNMKGILLGGAGPSKESFANGSYLKALSSKIITVQDIAHSGEVALEELVSKSEAALEKEEVLAEKKIVNSFLTELGKDSGLAVYGKQEVFNALNSGVVDKLFLSEDLPNEVIEEFTKTAENFNTKVFLISQDTKEGKQLFQLGGFGAVLRFKID